MRRQTEKEVGKPIQTFVFESHSTRESVRKGNKPIGFALPRFSSKWILSHSTWYKFRRSRQSLIAVLAGLQIPFLCTESHELGEEMVASYLYQVHLYNWLEANDFGRFLADNDL